ncbi:hypothetical protein RC62_2727 [Flavobacterium aquidurense]|uniref:Uncharacterized protein n=1 Tax=Flavobacterium aquidurense TaxID=362413 RepID=A0A0Q0WP56_9FLAO|nr:hypothetical protein RC62_2727 [Flavobacterium aquidurense]
MPRVNEKRNKILKERLELLIDCLSIEFSMSYGFSKTI